MCVLCDKNIQLTCYDLNYNSVQSHRNWAQLLGYDESKIVQTNTNTKTNTKANMENEKKSDNNNSKDDSMNALMHNKNNNKWLKYRSSLGNPKYTLTRIIIPLSVLSVGYVTYIQIIYECITIELKTLNETHLLLLSLPFYILLMFGFVIFCKIPSFHDYIHARWEMDAMMKVCYFFFYFFVVFFFFLCVCVFVVQVVAVWLECWL